MSAETLARPRSVAEGGGSAAADWTSLPGQSALDRATAERLRLYRDELLTWNQRFNLTAITEPDAVDRRLIGDALRLLPALDQAIASVRRGDEPVRLVDVGTGAGFPGMALKIARPDLDVTLIDATGKKITFLRHLIKTLQLDGVTAVHGRAEELGHDSAYRRRYALATARAVAVIPALLELCLPLLRVGGRALFPKGPDLDEELAAGERAARTLGGRIERADALPAVQDAPVTRLVIAAKIHETPIRFPRRSGLPAKEPLGRTQ